MRTRLTAAAFGATTTLFLTATSALAAPESGAGPQVGQNLGELLGGWAKALFIGVAALVSLMFLLNRRYAELAVFVVAAIVVGGFVLAPESVAGTVESIWRTVTGA